MRNPAKGRPYFEGWYLKHQNEEETVAFIPAFHGDRASLQLITDSGVYRAEYPADEFHMGTGRQYLMVGNSVFSGRGCRLNCTAGGLECHGELRYTLLSQPGPDIMGPFRFVPFMQCRHSVFSPGHRVDGRLNLNGREIRFENGSGYWEGDRGRSFPSQYLWTQCNWQEKGVMLSVADIPLGPIHFTGCIGCVVYGGKEFRFATYRGARVRKIEDGAATITQDDLCLTATLLERAPQPLQAPVHGKMARTIYENATCTVRYTLARRDRILFDFTSRRASFESEWRSADEPAST